MKENHWTNRGSRTST